MTIEILHQVTEINLRDLKNLIGELNAGFSGKIDEAMLRDLVESRHHAVFVAKENSKTIGLAILTEILDLCDGRIAYLSDFVIGSKVRAQGVGSAIWGEMLKWCRQRDIRLMEFTSNPSREAAHRFYLNKGCKLYDTTVFKLKISE